MWMNSKPLALTRSHPCCQKRENSRCILHSRTNTAIMPTAVRSAVIGNAGTLVAFRVGSRDSELLAPEFRQMEPGTLSDQEPFTAWLRRGIGRASDICRGQVIPAVRRCPSHPRAEPAAVRPLSWGG